MIILTKVKSQFKNFTNNLMYDNNLSHKEFYRKISLIFHKMERKEGNREKLKV